MALDIHKSNEKNKWLLSLDDAQFDTLLIIFNLFYIQSGIRIDRYRDCELSVDSQKHLIKIIDKYIEETDLNTNKNNIVTILSFRGFLLFTIAQNWALMIYGD